MPEIRNARKLLHVQNPEELLSRQHRPQVGPPGDQDLRVPRRHLPALAEGGRASPGEVQLLTRRPAADQHADRQPGLPGVLLQVDRGGAAR